MSSSATAEEVRMAVDGALAQAGVEWSDVTAIATLSTLRHDARLQGLGLPIVGFATEQLAGVGGVSPSPRALVAVGTPSVAEAAALLGAGPGSRLVAEKRRAGRVTIALARS